MSGLGGKSRRGERAPRRPNPPKAKHQQPQPKRRNRWVNH